jgi:hypothetical protein
MAARARLRRGSLGTRDGAPPGQRLAFTMNPVGPRRRRIEGA